MVEVCRAITKHHYLVQNARDIARVVKEAFHLASTGRPGPVLIDVPKDVQNTAVPNPNYDVAMDLPGYRLPPPPSAETIRAIAEAIKGSRRPIIYCGGGVIAVGRGRGAARVRQQDGHPGRHDACRGSAQSPPTITCSLGMLGMHGTVYSNYAINEADLLLALGVRFDDRVTGKLSEFAKHGRIVHVDIDASEINKNKAAHLAVNSDVKSTLAAAEPPGRAGRLPRVAQADRRLPRGRPDDLRPARRRDHAAVRDRPVLEARRRRLPDDHRRRPAPDVGRAVDEVQRGRGRGSPPAASARWASASPPRWAPRPRSPTRWSSTSTATARS